MFYRLLTGDRLITALIIFLISAGIWAPAFISPDTIPVNVIKNPMPFYRYFHALFNGGPFLSRLITFCLLLFEAFLLVRINAKFILVQQRTFLPALFFILITSHSPVILQWNPVLPAAVAMIMVLEIIFRSYKDNPDSYRFFDAGIILGLGSLFYGQMVYMLVFIWISSMVQRPFYWREYFFPILGFLIPYIFVFAVLFLKDQSLDDFLHLIASNFYFEFDLPEYHWTYWIFAIYLGLLILMSSVFFLRVFQFRKIYIRDYFKVLFWLFIMGSLVFLLFSGFYSGISYIIGIPLSFILTNYFINARKNFGNKVLFYLLIIYVIFLSYNNLTGLVK